MHIFKIFVAGTFSAGKTEFVHALSETDYVSTEIQYSHTTRGSDRLLRTVSLDFGQLTFPDALGLYFFANPGAINFASLLKAVNEKQILAPVAGSIAVIDSAFPGADGDNIVLLKCMQEQNQPYIVALSKQDLPNARTPQQVREILAIPDDIKVLSYDLKDPSSTKKVVLALVELFPRDELTQQVIEGLKAKIE